MNVCINEDCCEYTENIGGLCPACMGLAQKRAEATRKAAENAQNRAGRALQDNLGKGVSNE